MRDPTVTSERARQVIELRRQGHSYTQVGLALDPPVCRERVRQILVMHDVSLTGYPPKKPPVLCKVCSKKVSGPSPYCVTHSRMPKGAEAERLVKFILSVQDDRLRGLKWREIAAKMGMTSAVAMISKYARRLATAKKYGLI